MDRWSSTRQIGFTYDYVNVTLKKLYCRYINCFNTNMLSSIPASNCSEINLQCSPEICIKGEYKSCCDENGNPSDCTKFCNKTTDPCGKRYNTLAVTISYLLQPIYRLLGTKCSIVDNFQCSEFCFKGQNLSCCDEDKDSNCKKYCEISSNNCRKPLILLL